MEEVALINRDRLSGCFIEKQHAIQYWDALKRRRLGMRLADPRRRA